MICKNCNNLLVRQTGVQELKFFCKSCGSEFKSETKDTLLYMEEGNAKFNIPKNGKLIYNYPSNSKILKKCPSCNYGLISYELDDDLNRLYGCQCGHSWKEIITS